MVPQGQVAAPQARVHSDLVLRGVIVRCVACVTCVTCAGCGRLGFDPLSSGTARSDSDLSGGGGDGNGNGDGDGSGGNALFASCDVPFTATDHFATNATINAQNGWFVDTAANFDEQVLASGTAAHAGIGVWHISNRIVSSGFGNMPRSPQLSENAAESTVRTAGGGDSAELVLWFRLRNGIADGSAITLNLSPPDGNRLTYVDIRNDRDGQGGLQLRVVDYNIFNGQTLTIATGLPRQTWMKLRMVLRTVAGSRNDVFDISRDGVSLGTYGSWDGYYYSVPPLIGVDRLMVRLDVPPSAISGMFPDANAQGFDVDDLCYRVYDSSAPMATIDAYRTGFEP